jgi:hypothetical protein
MRYVPLGSISTAVLLIAGACCMVGTVVGAILIGPHNRLDFRHNAPLPLPGLGNSPILQVELARNEDDLRAVLMVGDIQNNLRDARAGNLLDTFLFIPGYAGFLFVVGALLARTDSRLHCALLLALAAVPAIATFDWLENLGIARTLDHIAHDGAPHCGDAQRISGPSMVKWTLLAVVLVIYGLTAAGARKGWPVTGFGISSLVAGALLAIRLGGYFRVRFL